jgi:hypothetical protein
MTLEQLKFYYPNRSIPEFVMGTWLGYSYGGLLIACEGSTIPTGSETFTGFDYCYECNIRKYCFLRLNEFFTGGER